jgi:hypothetical protein
LWTASPPVGQGRILLGDDLAALMAKAKIAREPMADHGLKFIRRTLPGEVVYFIANQSAKPVDAWIRSPRHASPPYCWTR